jgi:hypothetical protein
MSKREGFTEQKSSVGKGGEKYLGGSFLLCRIKIN